MARTHFVDNAFTAHVVYTPEVRHPVEVSADEEKHLVGWLSKRLGARVEAPSLSRLGYELLGGRLLASDGGPAAQFMYQNQAGKRLTLFVRHKRDAEQDTAFRFAKRNGIQGFYWVDRELGYALIGDIDRSNISQAAHIVYTELNE
jgi:anti-sigma factor RsiW